MISRNRTRPPRRPRYTARSVRPRPADRHLCNACAYSILSTNQTQSNEKYFNFASFERIREELTSEPLCYLYARLYKKQYHRANAPYNERLELVLFREIATLQTAIIDIKNQLQTLSKTV